MKMYSVQALIDNALFYDCEALGLTRDELLLRKLGELSDAFMDSCQELGIMSPICYDEEQNMIHEGCHRLIVAYMLGIEEIQGGTYLEIFNSDFLDRQDEMGLPLCQE
jgi:hypothetical protein